MRRSTVKRLRFALRMREKSAAAIPVSRCAPRTLRCSRSTAFTISAARIALNCLRRTDITQSRIDRLEGLPETDIAWTNPAKRPVQSVILGGNDALGGAATGARATNTALVLADDHTGAALDKSTTSTGNALTKTVRGVTKALRKTVTNTGKVIGID
jgi:hypothetical protein